VQIASPAEAAELPIFEQITRLLCQLCYQKPWSQKVAGCAGLHILVSRTPMSLLLKSELTMTRALCAVWKESAADEIPVTAERSYNTLAGLLRRCHGMQKAATPEAAACAELEKSSFKDVMNFLGMELFAPNVCMRSNVQKIMGEISEVTGQCVATLLEPFRASMSSQMFKRKLQTVPVQVQIGHIDALTFCLSLQPPFLVNDPGLIQLLTVSTYRACPCGI
jgi:transformation/transcription domain-associated protein